MHTLRVWRVVILLMRAKYVGPARVNTQFQGRLRNAHIYAICTLYIAHTAHLFLHTFCTYNEIYNQRITDYLYNRYAQYSIDYIQDTQIVCCA